MMTAIYFFVPLVCLCEVSLPKTEVAEAETSTSPFAVWLGKQTNSGPKGHFRSVVDASGSGESDWKWEHRKDSLEIRLRIVAGKNVKLPDTQNGYTTLINGEVGSIQDQADLQIQPDSFYVVGIVNKTNDFSRHYVLNIRIAEGPLKNAVVHLRDYTSGRLPSEKDPYVAVYKIPDHMKFAERDLEFHVIRIFAK